ncbi:uncharacterized protein LOC111265431 isoform X3 [Varroa jacobsoni]|uniref:Uncharacterized protein n=1 Tax=Varroa destructor TaxID=109461 RepID=A0A7M7KBN6_VARDE|nr:uncharacterized protein LOC111250222 isoform X2 [Varroa destructor]XP_022697849.1 uncharacterized protein LOC111265431 isoform X3 [Varroa jacobsoni]
MMRKDLRRATICCGSWFILIAVLLRFTVPSDTASHGYNYDEATQEKVIEAFSGLGFTDDCMDYLKSGSAEDCGRCVGSMNLTERLCIVLGGNPEVCFLRCAVKRCCSRNEEDSIEPSRYNSPRTVLLGIANTLMEAPANSTHSCLQCLPVDNIR